VELPTVAYPQNPDWVSWPASDAALFSALAHDRSVQPAAREHRQADRGPASAVGRGQVRGLTATRSPPAHPTGRPTAHPTTHPTGRPAAQPPNLARTYGGITGGTNVCHDSAAFAGPRGGS